jgi:hypothetical protein
LRQYGADKPAGAYEFDHLEALEIGGAPDNSANLWPEALTSARVKDRVENAAHNAVCSQRITLAEAQQAMAHDWVTLAQRLGVATP